LHCFNCEQKIHEIIKVEFDLLSVVIDGRNKVMVVAVFELNRIEDKVR
jgi:hypothetical protein